MYDDSQLCRVLLEMPARYNYLYTLDSEKALLRALFTSLSSNGKYTSFFFPHGPPPMSDYWRMNSGGTDASHSGRPCMHQFEKGEPTYKCKYVAPTLYCFVHLHANLGH